MRFSAWLSHQQPWDDLLAATRHIEATGWDGVYVADHFMGDGGGFGPVDAPNHEATALLAALAAATDRVRLGSLVLGATYRHPAVLANWASTVDHVSAGRLLLGLGAGWQENEHAQYGIELGSPGTRIARFDEYLAVVAGLLRQRETTVVGDHFQVRDAIAEPKPVQEHLPLLVGGKGDRMLGLVARHADEWNMWSLPDVQRERAAVLAQRCEAIGRDPGTIRRSTQALVMLTDDEQAAERFNTEVGAVRAAYGGTPAGFARIVAGWRDAGVDEVIVPDFVLGRGAQKLDAYDALLDAVADFRG
jgi:alkanesulfonate monooxygenase SsuD/methylene tetrahydromethanopterin reductase-like flavin-dependent oxidoreductase (luciferase family)